MADRGVCGALHGSERNSGGPIGELAGRETTTWWEPCGTVEPESWQVERSRNVENWQVQFLRFPAAIPEYHTEPSINLARLSFFYALIVQEGVRLWCLRKKKAA